MEPATAHVHGLWAVVAVVASACCVIPLQSHTQWALDAHVDLFSVSGAPTGPFVLERVSTQDRFCVFDVNDHDGKALKLSCQGEVAGIADLESQTAEAGLVEWLDEEDDDGPFEFHKDVSSIVFSGFGGQDPLDSYLWDLGGDLLPPQATRNGGDQRQGGAEGADHGGAGGQIECVRQRAAGQRDAAASGPGDLQPGAKPLGQEHAQQRGHDQEGEDQQHAGDGDRRGHHHCEARVEQEIPEPNRQPLGPRLVGVLAHEQQRLP